MSARDDQPATVPPPAGEDDAYSATTKVGAMPADIMEKLRAEGLLPEDAQPQRETPVVPLRPATSLEKRSAGMAAPAISTTPPSSGKPVPQLFSAPPPGAAPSEEAPNVLTAKPPPPAPVADSIETPVAFAFPPVSQLPATSEAPPVAESKPAPPAPSTPQKAGAKPPSKLTMILVGAVVVVLLIVALMRLRG